jgi:ABC-type antimicrobial peptide transport system permease subunit
VRQAITLAGVGLAVGLALALPLSRLIERLLFGVEPQDPVTYVAVIGVLLGSALLAAYIPARRASRISPITALRYD